MSELTREQVEAMDETMKFSTHRVTQMHRRRELADHFAPGVIEKHERVTWIDVALALLFYVLGAALLAALFAFGAWLAVHHRPERHGAHRGGQVVNPEDLIPPEEVPFLDRT